MLPKPGSSSDHHVDVSQHFGLVNLGNSCYFNSILQVASATRSLHALYHPTGDYALPTRAATNAGLATAASSSRPLHRRTVPALLLADEEAGGTSISPPLSHEEADQLLYLCKLSNAFRMTLEKTWKKKKKDQPGGAGVTRVVQSSSSSSPTSISPKQLLKVMADRYDQFGDYAQQDCHELLRLMLDSMRMEEMDFIKKVKSHASLEGAADTSFASSSAGSSRTSLSVTASEDEDEGLTPGKSRPSFLSLTPRYRSEGPGDKTPTFTRASSSIPSGDQEPSPAAPVPLPDLAAFTGYDHGSSASPPDHDQMGSLVDYIWGGQLTSMVVCEGCRHVSHTKEDFFDLSLPLRPEDAATATSIKEKRASRLRSMSERWRNKSNTANGSSNAAASLKLDTRENILRGALGEDVVESPDASAVATLQEKSGSRRFSGSVSADEGEREPSSSSSSWTAWATSLGRSRSTRPASRPSSAFKPGKRLDENTVEVDAIDMPDIASLALSPESSSTSYATRYGADSSAGLDATLAHKTRGSKDLLTALSNASRPGSRAPSRTQGRISPGIERSHSPMSANGHPTKRADQQVHPHAGRRHHHHHHHHHQQHALSHGKDGETTGTAKRQPSRQAAYIARVFGDLSAGPSVLSSSAATLGPSRDRVRSMQAGTGLVTALRAFTSSEVLSDENAFNCKRCWRRLNPPKGTERERLRRRRLRRGKAASGSEDSEDDEDDGEDGDRDHRPAPPQQQDTIAPPSRPTILVAPRPTRPAMDIVSDRGASDLSDTGGEDTYVPQLPPPTLVVQTEDHRISSAVAMLEAEASTGDADHDEASHGPSQSDLDGGSSSGSNVATSVGEGQQEGNSAGAVATFLVNSAAQEPPSQRQQQQQTMFVVNGAKQLGSVAMQPSASTTTQQSQQSLSDSVSWEASGPADGSLQTSDSDANQSTSSLGGGTTDSPDRRRPQTNSIMCPPRPSTTAASSTTSMPRPSLPSAASSSRSSRPKRSAQSIPRRALKRYLISQFPPTLVFHFKRFQADSTTSRSSSFFSSSGGSNSFKKIDDVVSYPEWLDMSEWMAPPREEYDRFGRLKPTSDPRVLEAYQREQEMDASLTHDDSCLPSSDAATDPPGNLTVRLPTPHEDSLKRKPSRWSRARARSNAGSTLAVSPATSAASSRVSSPALGAPPSLEALKEVPTEATSQAPGTGSEDEPKAPLYKLYGVVQHHGSTMHGGHYTAYVLSDRANMPASHKETHGGEGLAASSASSSSSCSSSERTGAAQDTRQWVYCSDTSVRPATLDQVLKSKEAYLLWYERVE